MFSGTQQCGCFETNYREGSCVEKKREKGKYLTKSYDSLLVVLKINVALAVFQPYRDLEAGDNQSLKFKW